MALQYKMVANHKFQEFVSLFYYSKNNKILFNFYTIFRRNIITEINNNFLILIPKIYKIIINNFALRLQLQ